MCIRDRYINVFNFFPFIVFPAYISVHLNESINGKSFQLSSSFSLDGIESLTMPQPANTLIFFFLIMNDLIKIFAGCGIVNDSIPSKENEELNWKLLPLIDALK